MQGDFNDDLRPDTAFLTKAEIMRFFHDRIVPGLDFLFGEGFIDYALPGSKAELFRQFPGDDGLVQIEATAEIWAFDNPDSVVDDSRLGERCFSVTVSVGRQVLEESVEVFTEASIYDENRPPEDRVFDEDDEPYDVEFPSEDQLRAWNITWHFFSNSPDDDVPLRRVYKELQDASGLSHWSELDRREDENKQEPTGVLSELEEVIDGAMTKMNLMGVLAMLAAVGVPDEVLFTKEELSTFGLLDIETFEAHNDSQN